ncbi:GNAT family N-acetyltransferase [Cohnella yongneupensis]|uniref:GNAT family N-acetyltransferase n=1 Tax=Cohnella yongneupensis TaxID=425006 RepID=A0ABW0R0G3_9BACL
MSIQIARITKGQKQEFLNLYNLYLYDLSPFTGEDPKGGKFDPTNTYLYLERAELHPFFIRHGDRNVGFILVTSQPFVDEGIDYSIQELFLLKKYRGMSLAKLSVEQVLERFKGRVKVAQVKNNTAAVRFWNKFYKDHAIDYSEHEEIIEADGLAGQLPILYQVFINR